MKSHLIVPIFVLWAICGLLIWRAADDAPTVKRPTAVAALAVPTSAPIRLARSDPPVAGPTPNERRSTADRSGTDHGEAVDTDPWPNTEPVNTLRGVQSGDTADQPAAWRAAIAEVLPVLATDQNVQLLLGDMLTSKGDLIDGLAWQLLACMYCTPVDRRIGYDCVAEGLCDPNLTLIDAYRRDFGEQAVADALLRMEEIEARIAINDPSALAIFTEIDDRRFPKDVGECVQLRTPTPECPPEEILRQTKEAYDYE